MIKHTYPPLTEYIDQDDYDVLLAHQGAERDILQLSVTLVNVAEAICPWPCIKIRNDWWFTADGALVANCQWILYGHEAVELEAAATLLKVTRPGVSSMITRGVLQAYRLPDEKLKERPINGRSGWPENPWYVRMSQLEAINVGR